MELRAMQGSCEPQPLDTLPPPQAAVPGRGQANSQQVSVPIFVQGLEHISEMHEMQGRGGIGPICCSRPGSWVWYRPLSCAEGLPWVASTACSNPWALRNQRGAHS